MIFLPNKFLICPALSYIRRIRHIRTGYVMDVPTDFLYESKGVLRVNDVTDYRPAIAPGETLSIVRETDRGYWIKKNGVSGWYSGRIERL